MSKYNGQLAGIVEAMVFAAAEPLSAQAMCRVLENCNKSEIQLVVDQLNGRYTEQGNAFRIREVAGGYQMCTRAEYASFIEALLARTKRQRLSAAALETLAVIVYRQPVSTPELEKIRGVESSGVLRTLLERKLIAIVGRSEKPGRPLLYGTTKDFLYYFGLNDVSELPRIDELHELTGKQTEEQTDLLDTPEASPNAVEVDEHAPEAEPVEDESIADPTKIVEETTPVDSETEERRLVFVRGAEEVGRESLPTDEIAIPEIGPDVVTEKTKLEPAYTLDVELQENEIIEDWPQEETPADSDDAKRDENNEAVETAREIVTEPVE